MPYYYWKCFLHDLTLYSTISTFNNPVEEEFQKHSGTIFISHYLSNIEHVACNCFKFGGVKKKLTFSKDLTNFVLLQVAN